MALDLSPAERGEQRAVLWSIVAFWTLHLAVLTAISLAASSDPWGVIPRRMALVPIAAGLCLGIHRVLKRTGNLPFRRTALAAGVLALAAAAVYGAVTTAILYYGIGYADMPYKETLRPYTMAMFIEDAFLWLYSFSSWTGLYLALVYNAQVRDRERRLSQVEALAHKAQVRALRYQINPHFLFNTLNSVSAMIWERDLDRAEGMVLGLSSFLRTTLEIDPSEDVTLAQEIALQRLYLDIEQIRFPERLKVEFDIPPELDDARVPSLILQPLVENAIKYGVAPSHAETRLRISAARQADALMLRVEDDGIEPSGQAFTGAGVGLLNVRQRLATRFGERWFLDAGPASGSGFCVHLGIPLRYA